MGLACVAYILVDGQILNILMDKAALVFVLGGTFASTMMTYPFRIFKKIPTGYKLLMFPPKFIPVEFEVDRMCELAEVAHLRGIDALPEQLKPEDLEFLRSGVLMLMNEWTKEDIQIHLELDMQSTIDRHGEVQRMFESMGTYAPIYGLLGTLIGVLGLLRFLGDPKGMGNAMAKAITTFYGIFFANFFALPVAGKLEMHTAHEMLIKRVITEGIIGIKQEINPLTLRQKLNMVMAQGHRKKA
jgi:chemotaxis protein MotA